MLTSQDSNTGLVNQVVGAVLESKILKIKSLYTRLTIDQLVARVATSRPKSADEVVAKLQDMVSFSPSLYHVTETLDHCRSSTSYHL